MDLKRNGMIAASLLVLVLLMSRITNQFYLGILFHTLIWAGLAGSWNILGGFAGQFFLAHGAFFGIGAYTSTLLMIHFNLSPWLGMVAGGTLSAIIGVFLGAICFKLKGHYFTLATLAFGQLMYILAVSWRSLTKGTVGLAIPINPSLAMMVFRNRFIYVLLAFFFVLLVVAVTRMIDNSRLGYFLTAYREDDDAARTIGVNTIKARLMASAVSSFLAALAGTLYAQYVFYIDPELFAIYISAQGPLIAIIGGLGTSFGPIFGAILVIPIAQILRATFGSAFAGVHYIIYGLVLIIVLFVIPEGLFTRFSSIVIRFTKALARRRERRHAAGR